MRYYKTIILFSFACIFACAQTQDFNDKVILKTYTAKRNSKILLKVSYIISDYLDYNKIQKNTIGLRHLRLKDRIITIKYLSFELVDSVFRLRDFFWTSGYQKLDHDKTKGEYHISETCYIHYDCPRFSLHNEYDEVYIPISSLKIPLRTYV